MTTSRRSLRPISIDKARKDTHGWIGRAAGWVMLVFSIPFSIVGWLGVHFSLSLKWLVGMGCIVFSLWWSTENYYMGYGGGNLWEDINRTGLQFSMVMGFFLCCLVQFFQMESARERARKKTLKDVASYRPNETTILVGFFFYGLELLIWISSLKFRFQGGLTAIVVACLVGFVSIWGFEKGVQWIENKE